MSDSGGKNWVNELLLLQRISLGLQCEHLLRSENVDDFVKETAQLLVDALSGGHLWALEWEGYNLHTVPSSTADEVGNILTMWRVLTGGYDRLSEEDQKEVLTHTSHRAREDGKLRFPGFDGNEESAHLSVAMFLVEKMNRFQELDARNLNSHWPMLDEYRRMWDVFNDGFSSLRFLKNMSKDDIIGVFMAGEQRR